MDSTAEKLNVISMILEAKDGASDSQTQKDRTVGRCIATMDLQRLHEITLPKKVSFKNLSSPGAVKASYNIYINQSRRHISIPLTSPFFPRALTPEESERAAIE